MRLAVLLVVLLGAAPADAHGLRTAYVDLGEVSPGRALVHLRISALDPALGVASDCTLAATGEGSAYDRSWVLDCGSSLDGHTLSVRGLGPIISDAVVATTFADGTTTTQLVRDDGALQLRPVPASRPAVAREFVGLGLLHIVTGYDHLLFLLLLVLLLRDVRSVLLAETAFTISHSLAFTATALGVVQVSSAAAEVCIALSLVLLAADIPLGAGAPARRWRGAAMALVFGFVHGLGFAGGLREIGLPEHAIGTALVGFAAGIEVGQVAFLTLVLGTLYALRRAAYLPRLCTTAVYAAGGLSAYWCIERAFACFA